MTAEQQHESSEQQTPPLDSPFASDEDWDAMTGHDLNALRDGEQQ